MKLAVTSWSVFCARQRASGILQASAIQVVTDWISVIKLLVVAAVVELPPVARSGAR
jgi:hypothetical protein